MKSLIAMGTVQQMLIMMGFVMRWIPALTVDVQISKHATLILMPAKTMVRVISSVQIR